MHPAYAAQKLTSRREELIRNGVLLVRRMAFRMARRLPPHVCVDDLIAAGCEGLVRAADSYDPARAPSFEAYARERIRGAILDELRVHDPMTSYGRRRLSAVSAMISTLERSLGRAPTEEEIAAALEMDIAQYRQLAEHLARGPALAQVGSEPDEVESGRADPAATLEGKELRAQLVNAIAELPDRTQTIVALYYQEECTQAEIAEVLGITESRVCQLLGEAMARIRASIERAASPRSATIRKRLAASP